MFVNSEFSLMSGKHKYNLITGKLLNNLITVKLKDGNAHFGFFDFDSLADAGILRFWVQECDIKLKPVFFVIPKNEISRSLEIDMDDIVSIVYHSPTKRVEITYSFK